LQTQNKLAGFEEAVLPHLDAAYNLARWLTRDEADAEDVVQEATLRAFRYFGSFHRGMAGRPWLLGIVRNTFYTWMQQNRKGELLTPLDESLDLESHELSPEELLLQKVDSQMVRQALEELPVEFREVIVLRELEGMTYKEVAGITDLPLGTVMSRLARARKRLQQSLIGQKHAEVRS
jgi:RNA polymerase sigma-70 factor (ECF subfamily)